MAVCMHMHLINVKLNKVYSCAHLASNILTKRILGYLRLNLENLLRCLEELSYMR